MKKSIYLLLTMLFCQLQLLAHNAQIKGNLIDDQTKNSIEGATIELVNTNVITSTNANGTFILSNVPQGSYVLKISSIGYDDYTRTLLVIDYTTSSLQINLLPKKISLQEVVIKPRIDVTRLGINKINLKKAPINSAQDLLRVAPGLVIAQHAGGGKAEQIFLRGFDCDHGTDIAIQVDGMPVNMVSHAHGQGYADLHFVIPEMVDYIDVNKGPYKASVGNFATAGSIQMQTKNTLEKNSISIEKGMYQNNRIVAMGNLSKFKKANTNLIGAIAYQYYGGYFESPMNLNQFNAQLKYKTQVGAHHLFSAQATGFTNKWNASGQIPLRAIVNKNITRFGAIDSTEGGNTSRLNISTTLMSKINNGGNIQQQLFYSKNNFNLYSNFTFFKNDTINGDMIQQFEDRSIIGYNGTYKHNKFYNNTLVRNQMGIQLRSDILPQSELTNVKQRYTFLRPFTKHSIQENNLSIYGQKIIEHKKWTVEGGLRYDVLAFKVGDQLNNKTSLNYQDIWSPKLNLYYTVSPKLQLYFLNGKGFHSNDARLVATNTKEILPAAFGTDIGLISKPNPKTFIQISLWRLNLQQEFIYVGDEAVVEASGATRRVGFDISFKQNIGKRLSIDADFNYAHARIKNVVETENKIALAPPITSTGGVQYTSKGGASASIRYRAISNRPANEFNSRIAEGFTLVDAVLYFPYKKFGFSLIGENVLNSQWKEAQFETESRLQGEDVPVTEMHFTAGTPINLRLKVGYSF